MLQKSILLQSLLLLSFFCKGQQIEKSINHYGDTLPREIISLHFDKEAYLPGETIWFKAYLFEENLPSSRSKNFYAALYDEQGKLLQQMRSPIVNSSTDGHFDVPDSFKSRQLTCRAYTTWMLGVDSAALYSKAIRIIQATEAKASATPVKTLTSLQFFPEGGDMIEDAKNTIAFKANLSNGLPVEVSGTIKNKVTGAEVMPFKTVHNGMGRFDLDVEKGDRFVAAWTDINGVIHETPLPAPKPAGVSLKMVRLKDKLYYNIVNSLPGDSLHVIMYMYQKVCYKSNVSVKAGEPFNGTVPLGKLPSGVLQATVFDANWQPVAERVVFINNANFTAAATISNTTIKLTKRAKNEIEIAVSDSIPFNLSVSITDAVLNDGKIERNIFTDMLLGGDVKGYIHDPAYYFSDNSSAEIAANLDLVMLTHGWRRYNWKSMLEGKEPPITKADDNYLILRGEVGATAIKKLGADEKISLLVKTKDSTNRMYSAVPDNKGAFSKEGLMFFDTATVSYSFRKNTALNGEISLKSIVFPAPPLAVSPAVSGFDADQQLAAIKAYLAQRKEISNLAKVQTLDSVVVKVPKWKNDPLVKMDQRYTTGLFSGSNGIGFDVAHDKMAVAKFDIYNYMMGKVPGITTRFTNGFKTFVASDGIQILCFINESGVDNDQVALINPDEIGYVKYIERWGGALGFPHALAFYYKKGADRFDNPSANKDMKVVKVAGYTPIKEFYSPDYSTANTPETSDNRITLLWVPYVITNAVNKKVPLSFYNNDFSKKLRVVLEGINDDGKMVHIEKILE